MSESTAIDTWMMDRLTTHADMVSAFATSPVQVAEGLAPDQWKYPFVVFQNQSNIDTNGIGPSARVLVTTTYLVRAIVRSDTYGNTALKSLAAAIDIAIDGASGVTVDGHVLGCRRNSEYRLTEPVDGRPIRHLGGIYTIWASAL